MAHRDREYRLEDQIGFLLRKASQRHIAIFGAHIAGLTPQQFSALVKTRELGPVSQNRLGRATAMDAATVKGVADRLRARGLVRAEPDPDDRRQLLLSVTEAGARMAAEAIPRAKRITEETLAPLSAAERATLLRLLNRLA